MITLGLIQKKCKEDETCCNKCPFSYTSGNDYIFNECMFMGTPDHWKIDMIENAFKNFLNDDVVDDFYKGLSNKLLEVMKVKKEGEDNEGN